jgi:hypothetical protein
LKEKGEGTHDVPSEVLQNKVLVLEFEKGFSKNPSRPPFFKGRRALSPVFAKRLGFSPFEKAE